jgi:hypothetical protein
MLQARHLSATSFATCQVFCDMVCILTRQDAKHEGRQLFENMI